MICGSWDWRIGVWPVIAMHTTAMCTARASGGPVERQPARVCLERLSLLVNWETCCFLHGATRWTKQWGKYMMSNMMNDELYSIGTAIFILTVVLSFVSMFVFVVFLWFMAACICILYIVIIIKCVVSQFHSNLIVIILIQARKVLATYCPRWHSIIFFEILQWIIIRPHSQIITIQ